jgi:TolA-binding protein
LKEFRVVAEKYPSCEFAPDALFKAAECYAQLGLRNEAARTFHEFSQQYPENPLTEQAMLRSGDARFAESDFAEALSSYQKILESPGDPKVEEETLYRLAATHHNMKSFDAGVATYKKLLEKFPASAYAAEARYRIGEVELRQHQDALKAIEAYQACLDAVPEKDLMIRARQGLAAARYEQKDYEQAAEQLLQLVREEPQAKLDREIYLWCARYLHEQKRWSDSEQMFTALLEAYPEQDEMAEVLFLLGNCREQAGAIETAIEAYVQAAEKEKDPMRSAELKVRLAKLHEDRNETEAAMTLLESAANLDGGEASARARYNLAALQEAQGDAETAARNYMRLAILFVHETLTPEALWRAGNCYKNLSNLGQARSVFEELLADYPQSEFAEPARAVLATLTEPEKTAE